MSVDWRRDYTALHAERDALAAEVERLQQEADDWKAACEESQASESDLMAEIEGLKQELWSERGIMLDLKAEVERLREIEKAAHDFVATTSVFRLSHDSKDKRPGCTCTPPFFAYDCRRQGRCMASNSRSRDEA